MKRLSGWRITARGWNAGLWRSNHMIPCKHLFRRTLSVAVLASVVGCGQMKVEVSIFNREKANNSTPFVQADARQMRDEVLADRRQGRYDVERARIKQIVRPAYQAILEDTGKSRTIAMNIQDKLRNSLEREVDDTFAEANRAFDLGMAELDRLDALGAQYPGQRHAMAVSARRWFYEGRSILRGLYPKLNTFFHRDLATALNLAPPPASGPSAGGTTSEGTTDSNLPQESAESANRALNRVSRRVEGLIGDAGLMDDPMTPLVVSANRKFWRGTFNKTFGNGLFGNTDIAVKMQGLGDFTLKGVRNDATKTTPAAFQGALFMTKLAAASVGVPVGAFCGPVPPQQSEPSTGTAPASDTPAEGGDDGNTSGGG